MSEIDTLENVKEEQDGLPPFEDPQGDFPKKEYINVASTNLAARGVKTNEVYVGGGDVDMNLGLKTLPLSEYPYNQVRETITGHVTEMDDTPGRERLLFKHRTGSGVDMRPDGTVIISTKYNTIQITGNDHKVIVKGDGEIHYHGNLSMKVSGDFDMEVGGNYNLKVHGDKREDVRGNYQQKVTENHETSITGNKASYVVGTNTDTVLGDNNNIIKGDNVERTEGKIRQYSGDDIIQTAKNDINITSPSINIAATDLSAISTTGIIGGDNVFHYGKNYYGTSALFTAGVEAPTFIGDLTGKADDANQADYATTAGQSPLGPAGSPGTNNHTARDTSIRTSIPAPGPDTSLMTDYLDRSELGVRIVDIDVGEHVKNEIDRSAFYNGISKFRLNTSNVRSKLRDPNTVRNDEFIARAISEGILSASFVDQKPIGRKIGRIDNTDSKPKRPLGKPLGDAKVGEKVQYASNTRRNTVITPNQLYNPELQFVRDGNITAKTELGPGIKLAKFLGGYGDPVTLTHITDSTERVRIAKNLYLHAEFMKQVQDYLDVKNQYRLIVSEGFYKESEGETLEVDSLNYLQARGQVVVYELRDLYGRIPIQQTYNTAEFIKDYVNFEKMILDYDSYNPDGSLNAQIIIHMPEVNAKWEVVFNNTVETRFNNYTQTNGELVEIL
jgi:hypothetical protein